MDDPLIQSMSKEAVAGATNAVEAAHAIEAYVAKKITKKDFSTGFGSAADTAHSLEGDCTEHAVLVAALARAAGLPARVVMGLVYLNAPNAPAGVPKKFFGYHMWDEVLVANDTWLPVDAAIGAMDATHLAMGRSDLSSISPLTELILPVMQAMGGLQIEID